MKSRLLKLSLIFFIAAGLILGIISFQNEKGPLSYFFIPDIDKAQKTGFTVIKDINEMLPDKTMSFDYDYFKGKITSLFSGDVHLLTPNAIINGIIQNTVNSGAFRVVYSNESSDSAEYNIKFKERDSEYWLVRLITGLEEANLIISRFADEKETLIDNFTYKESEKGTKLLVVVFFRSYLVIINDKKVLYQQKSPSLEITGKIGFSCKNCSLDSLRVVKFAEIDEKLEQELISSLEGDGRPLREHKFNCNDDDWYPSLYRQYLYKTAIFGKERKTPRLRLGNELRTSIYLMMNSSLKYEVKIPDRAALEFYLTVVPKFVHEIGRLRFTVQIQKPDGEKLKSCSFNMGKYEGITSRFVKFSIDLGAYADKRCNIFFKFETTDGKLTGDEGKILLAFSSAALYEKRHAGEVNFILISLDTLRGDHLGCHGYFRDTSPYIDEFASKGTIFFNAASCSNSTLPSHLSILTGLYPSECGYVNYADGGYNSTYLADNARTIAEYLRDADYKTAGFHGGGFLSEYYGYDKGFEFYNELCTDAGTAVDEVLRWLSENMNHKFFIFFHTYEIHGPYTHNYFLSSDSESLLTPVGRRIAAYDSDIRYTDQHIGKLLNWLMKNNLSGNTYVIITSDHGENFKYQHKGTDEGVHGRTLYDHETYIPLIIGGAPPFNQRKRIGTQVSSVDILPTITALAGIPLKKEVRGTNLKPFLSSELKKERIVYSECVNTAGGKIKAVRSKNYKLIVNFPLMNDPFSRKSSKYELYDLSLDRTEKKNIWNSQNDVALKYLKILKIISDELEMIAMKSGAGKLRDLRMDGGLENQLKALGYLGN